MSTARDEIGIGAGVGVNHPDVSRRAVLGAGGALVAAMAAAGRSGVAAQGATPRAATPGPPAEPQFEWLGTLSAELGETITVGEIPKGTRLIVPVTGGTFTGPNLTATLVPPSADWVLVRPDGVAELTWRVTLQAEDGAVLYVAAQGYLPHVMDILPRWGAGEAIPREEYYLVVTPYFETGAAQYDWLQQTVTVGIGSLVPGGVSYEVYAVS